MKKKHIILRNVYLTPRPSSTPLAHRITRQSGWISTSGHSTHLWNPYPRTSTSKSDKELGSLPPTESVCDPRLVGKWTAKGSWGSRGGRQSTPGAARQTPPSLTFTYRSDPGLLSPRARTPWQMRGLTYEGKQGYLSQAELPTVSHESFVDLSKLSTGEKDTTRCPLVTSARSKLSLHPSMASAGGRGNSVVSLTFGYLFTVSCSLLKLLISAKRASWII